MKKRLIALLLAFLMISVWGSCAKKQPSENPPDENSDPSDRNESADGERNVIPPNYGTFYTDENGRRQNDLIRIEIAKENLTAPLTEIPYKLYNSSSYLMDSRNIYTDLEVKRDGEWVKAPGKDTSTRVRLDIWAYDSTPVWERRMKLGDKQEYAVLEAGEYRLIVTVLLWVDGKDAVVRPTVEFTVTAPVE